MLDPAQCRLSFNQCGQAGKEEWETWYPCTGDQWGFKVVNIHYQNVFCQKSPLIITSWGAFKNISAIEPKAGLLASLLVQVFDGKS